MNNLTVLKCPKCGSTCIDQFRMLIGPIWCRNCGFRVEEKEKHNPFIHQGESCEEKPTHARPEVEKFIAIIEDELCKRMDIDDFDRFFTELATELMRRYGLSVPADFGDNCPTCGLYIASCQDYARPEAVREAMEDASIVARWPIDERDSLEESLIALAAYVLELEADRDRLQKIIDNDPCLFTRKLSEEDILKAFEERDRLRERNAELEDLFDLQHARTVEAVGLWREAHPGNDLVMPDLGELLAWLIAERASALTERNDGIS